MEKFIQYLQSKNHSASTQNAYLANLSLFLKWTEKEAEQTSKKDVLKYLEHLQTKRQQQNVTRRNALIAINHYFAFLLKAEQVATNPAALIKIRGAKKKNLYRTYTPEELEQLFDNYHQLFVRAFDDNHIPKNQRQNSFLSRHRNAAILSLLTCQGLRTREIDQMLLQDIDLVKATVKIRSGNRKGNERTLPLKATQIGLLMHYVNVIRPQFFSHRAEGEKLFFALPACGKAGTESQDLMHAFKPLIRQLKSTDRNFLDFRQVRASVITNWLKNEGLRKAQYLAGHKSINSTEEYKPNQIEGLTEDIGKFNPF